MPEVTTPTPTPAPAAPPVAPAAPPAATPADDWRSFITDEGARSNQSIQTLQAKDAKEAIDMLAKQYVNAQSQIGKEKVLKPQKDWTPEQNKEWLKSVGLSPPDTLDGYDLSAEDAAAFKAVMTKEGFAELQKVFQKAGLTKEQAQAFSKEYYSQALKDAQKNQTAVAENLKAYEASLRKEWGAKYDENSRLVDYVLDKSMHSDKLRQLATEEPEVFKHPLIRSLLLELAGPFAQNRANDGLVPAAGSGSVITHSVDALNKIAQLQKDPAYTSMIRAGGPDNYRVNSLAAGKDPQASIDKYNAILKELSDLNKLATELMQKEQNKV